MSEPPLPSDIGVFSIERRRVVMLRSVPSPFSAPAVPASVSNVVSEPTAVRMLLYAVTKPCTAALMDASSRVTLMLVVPLDFSVRVTPWAASTTVLLWLVTSMPLIFSAALAAATFSDMPFGCVARAGS
ncbi:hypothetical protein D3C81_893860 [compost metagenome]